MTDRTDPTPALRHGAVAAVLVCPHVERSEDAVQVLPSIPANAHYVKCPCCGQRGWQTNDDDPVMVCPECMVQAVTVDA